MQEGENIVVLEINGVSSESGDIFHPKSSLMNAYQTLFRQWEIAFEIGHLVKNNLHIKATPTLKNI